MQGSGETRNFVERLPDALRATAQSRSYRKGASVFNQGDVAQAIYLVLDGEVRVVRFGVRGEEVILQHARRGDFFAEASLDGHHYHCSAVATKSTTVLRIPASAVRELLDRDVRFARQWVSLLGQQLRTTRARLERLALRGAASRVRHYLMTEGVGPHHEVRLGSSLRQFAHELGIVEETLYRTLARMEKAGLIERSGSTLRLGRKLASMT